MHEGIPQIPLGYYNKWRKLRLASNTWVSMFWMLSVWSSMESQLFYKGQEGENDTERYSYSMFRIAVKVVFLLYLS